MIPRTSLKQPIVLWKSLIKMLKWRITRQKWGAIATIYIKWKSLDVLLSFWGVIWWKIRWHENLTCLFNIQRSGSTRSWNSFHRYMKDKLYYKKEVKRLKNLGAMDLQWLSQWASQSFIQPKKNCTVLFLKDVTELNKWLGRKPFPNIKISTGLGKMEWLSYSSTMDSKTVHYLTRLDLKVYRIYTIVVHSGSPDISHAKMSAPMEVLETLKIQLKVYTGRAYSNTETCTHCSAGSWDQHCHYIP